MSDGSDGSQSAADPAGEPAVLATGVVTLVEGSSFCVSGLTGDIDPGSPQGLFFRDTRILSNWKLRVDGATPQPLTVLSDEPFHARFIARLPPRPGRSETDLLVERNRFVADGMREDVLLRNLGARSVTCRVSLAAAADFADLFEVKESRVRARGELSTSVAEDELRFSFTFGERRRGVRIAAEAADVHPHGIDFMVPLPPHSDWRVSLVVAPSIDGHEVPATFHVDDPLELSPPARRLQAWRRGSPRVITHHQGLRTTLEHSLEDLGALRIFDPRHPDEVAVAAGAPWFMALFGRDSLLSSYMALPLDQSLALGTLQTLARAQGSKVDAVTEEEPGRILHETRLGLDSSLALGGGSVYYGTVDATPLFVVLLGELARWGLGKEVVHDLLPHADRALAWIEEYGDRDGDGFVEYARATERGLVNQGWKDSGEGINFADGTLPEGPIALCEVQGYVYSAFVARSHFAYEAGDAPAATRWADKAAALRTQFNERFWLPDRGYFAIGLDGRKKPIDALASNMGHCLWSGIIDEDKAHSVAEQLLSPEMFSGWGVRTLATSMGAYNPMSYHNGSVWPHDNALLAAGLMRYGFVEAAQRIAVAVLEAAHAFGGRLPELFCGFDRREYPAPVPYPTSCSPQAWAAATPVQLVRTLLRVDPWMSRGQVWVSPAWPRRFGRLEVENLPLAGARVNLVVRDDWFEVKGLPPGVTLISEPRRPLPAAHAAAS